MRGESGRGIALSWLRPAARPRLLTAHGVFLFGNENAKGRPAMGRLGTAHAQSISAAGCRTPTHSLRTAEHARSARPGTWRWRHALPRYSATTPGGVTRDQPNTGYTGLP